MKYVKYTLIVILILAIGFFLIGIFKPAVNYQCQISVDKPVAEAWAVVQDEDKMSEWLPGFQRIVPVSGTPGTVGAVSEVYFLNDGQTMSIVETITNIAPEESISMSYTSDFMDMEYTLALEDSNGQTIITSTTTARGNGMISRSMMALFGNSLKEQEETNLANLKRTIEENTKDYFPKEEAPEEQPVEG